MEGARNDDLQSRSHRRDKANRHRAILWQLVAIGYAGESINHRSPAVTDHIAAVRSEASGAQVLAGDE
jgi:hypothetical protein